MARKGTYIREGDGALLLYHSYYFYMEAGSAFRNPKNKRDFHLVTDKDELKEFGSLKPGEYEERTK